MGGLTVDNPATLSAVLSSDKIIPGDVIKIMAGIYTGDYVCRESGTKSLPITLQPYRDGPVSIDGSFIFSNHIHVYDIDFIDSRIDRHTITPGITMTGKGNRLHGCSISQLHSDGVNWFDSELDNGGEISENIFLLNGMRYEDGSGHGHSVYSHNSAGGRRKILRNSMHRNLGNYSLQLFSSDNPTDDFEIDDNLFLWSVFCGGHFGPNNLIYKNNLNNHVVNIAIGMGTHTADNLLIDGNTFIDCSDFSFGGGLGTLTNVIESNNVVYGGQPDSRVGYAVTSKPEILTKWIPFTKSIRWVGMLIIYNRDSAPSISFDYSGLLPAGNYKFINTQNLAETYSFEYVTGSVNISTALTSGAFIGDDYEPDATWPVLGGLVIEKA